MKADLAFKKEEDSAALSRQVDTGVLGLSVLAGGFPVGISILAEIEVGSEAEVFAQQFTHKGLEAGEAVLYVSFVRSPTKIIESFERLEWSVDNYHLKGQLTFIVLSSLVS